MKKSSRKWLEAGEKAVSDDESKIKCPNCDHEFLRIVSVEFPNGEKRDLHLICDNCNARNTVTHSL